MLEYYERRAPEYDATSYGELGDADVAALVAFVSQLGPGRILDVACGTGYLTRLLRGEVVGVDQSAAMLEIARTRVPNAELVRAVVPPLPFSDDAFDLVFTSAFYGHIEPTATRRQLVSEALRVARELVVVEQTWRAGLPHETVEQRELADGSSYPVFKRYFEARELARELAGSVVLETDDFVAVRAARPDLRTR